MQLRLKACHRLRPACLLSLLPLLLIGCSSVPLTETAPDQPRAASSRKQQSLPSLPPAGSGRGGYYKDDGPGDMPPEGLLDTPDAEPRVEPYSTRANRPYVVFGKSYTPITDDRPLKQRGIGSWYGKKFHGQKTSSGEIYDMYKMTAAHPTLPIPSYVRVTNVANGRQVIVRVNDRGPFHAGRIIDLSYTAALKLGYLGRGSSELEVERLLPDDIARINAERDRQAPAPAPSVTAPQPVEMMPVVAVSASTGIETRALPPVQILPASGTGIEPPAAPNAVPAAASGTVAGPMSASTPGPAGFYVQLGAYSRQDNAEAARARLQSGAMNGTAGLEVVESGGWYRLHSGPYGTRGEAAAAAARLQADGGRPVIVQR